MGLFYRKKWHSLCNYKRTKEIFNKRMELFNKQKNADLVNKTTLSNWEKEELNERKLMWKEEYHKLGLECDREEKRGKWVYYPRFPRLVSL